MIIPQFPEGRDLKAVYLDPHPRLNTYADVVDESINPEVATWAMVVEMLNWQFSRGHSNNIGQDLTSARNELQLALARYPIIRRQKKAKLFAVPRGESSYTGDYDVVRL